MSTTAGSGAEIVAIDTPALGDRSYLADDGSVALVVDPQRDIDRALALALAAARGVRITDVFAAELDRRAPVYVVCASGNRSAAMTSFLRSAGYDAYSVAGGTGERARAGRPVVGGYAPRA
jgi:rhodanese-related sulfurtransferase